MWGHGLPKSQVSQAELVQNRGFIEQGRLGGESLLWTVGATYSRSPYLVTHQSRYQRGKRSRVVFALHTLSVSGAIILREGTATLVKHEI